MSLEEPRQSSPPSATTPKSTTTATKNNTPNQFKHQQTATSLDHRDEVGGEHHKSSPITIQSSQATANSSASISQLKTEVMAMHNLGSNSSQHEHQLKNHQQTGSGVDASTWHNNNNNNNTNNNSNHNEGAPNTSNNDHVNESQQSSVTNNSADNKPPVTEGTKGQTGGNKTNPNRHQTQQPALQPPTQQHQLQQHQPQLQSQSQQYHGIFSPQFPAILQSSLESRVDQVIRTTLHNSPAYTPTSGRNNNSSSSSNNNNSTVNNSNVLNNKQSSNMPLQTTPTSLIFNPTTSSLSTTTSTQQTTLSQTQSSTGLMSGSGATSTPNTSIYGPTLSSMGDNLSAPNSNLLAKTSPSHSALAAAAALQSLNQSHIQRSQQQQLAHSQPSPYSSAPGAMSKQSTNGSGPPMPQAAHGGSIHQLSKLNGPLMAHSEQLNRPSFASEQSGAGSLNFSSRGPPSSNTIGGNNLDSKIAGPGPIGLSNMSWQEQNHGNSMISRLPPLHGLNEPIPPYASSSSHSPYGNMNSQLPGAHGSNNDNNMIGLDNDTLSKLNSMKSSPGQNNPLQFRDEKSFPLNFPTLMSNKQNNPNNDNSRSLPPNSVNEARRNMMIFSYNLLSPLIPGINAPKRIIPMDDEMKNAIQNGQFYLKYGHIASGILTNRMLVHHFNIIDYLRRDRFMPEEVESIERINRTLSISDLLCLMELIGHRSPNKTGPEANKLPLHLYADGSFMNAGGPGLADLTLANLHNNSPHKGGTFLSSSPNRSDMLGPPGVDRSRRSSQSPSDTSRSHLGGNLNHPKFTSSHNPNIHHQQQGTINPHQFTHPSNQQQLTSPQTNRSSPFQPPLPTGLNQSMTRPPKSHSTILDLNMASLNPSYTPPSTQIRQPLPAHQSSSRPNLTGLDLMTNPTSSTSVPVTAHMSSKTPQTPKLQDIIPKPNAKVMPMSGLYGSEKLGNKDSMMISHADIQNTSARFDLDSNSILSMQNHNLPRHPDSLKHSQAHSYLPPTMMGSGGVQIELGRQHESIDSGMNPHLHSNQPNQGHFNPSPRDSLNRNLGPGGLMYSGMPPSAIDHRQQSNDLSTRNASMGPGPVPGAPNDAQVKQYMAAIQQQMIMSGKAGEGSPNSMNVMNSIPPYMYQSVSQRPSLGEPMHIDTVQHVKQPQGPNSSPKMTNHRSIITGSGSSSSRKSKKAKPSPPAGSIDSKITSVDHMDAGAHNSEASDQTTNDLSLPRLSDSIESFVKSEPVTNLAIMKTNEIAPAASNADCAQSIGDADISAARENATFDVGGARVQVKSEIVRPNEGNISAPVSLKPSTELSEPGDHKQIDNTCKDQDITPEAKSGQVKQSDLTSNSTVADQPSKYQKLFTKKAWLKNYDLEDQARLNGEKPTIDDNMPVSTRASIKVEPKTDSVVDEEVVVNESKPSIQNAKPNGSKNGKTKPDSKKKGKEVKAKKVNVKASKTPTVKNNENDSEGTNESTSDPDDTDETDSLKSTNDKKLRRMPRRKVKLGCDRDPSDQSSVTPKTKAQRDNTEKETIIARSRGKKDKSTTPGTDNVVPSKRKYNSDDESIKQKTKKIKDNATKNTDSTDSSPNSKLKKRAGEKFLQTQPCYEIVPKSIRCLECRRVRQPSIKGDKVAQAKQVSKTNWDDFCRFFEFRKLRYNKSAQIVVAGFSEVGDAKETDMRLWNPSEVGEAPTNINYKVAKFILANIGDEFCKLVLQERAALKSYETDIGDKRITWKRAVNGLRELCDVCSTTLFNCHYVCDRCGFVVCIDCHGSRVGTEVDTDDNSIKKESNDASNNEVIAETEQAAVTNKKSKKDSYGWIFCAKNEEHSQDKLTLTRIIAGDCLEEVWSLLHDIRERLDLGQCCCKNPMQPVETKLENADRVTSCTINQDLDQGVEGSHSTLKGLLLASNDSPINGSVKTKQATELGDGYIKQNSLDNTFDRSPADQEMDFGSEDDSRQVSAAIEGCIASLSVDGSDDARDSSKETKTQLVDSVSEETSSRLCGGDLLVLSNAVHKENLTLFRDHWRHGKPVLVRGVHKRMDIKMWLPQFFLGKFGDYRSDLVDCRNGDIHRQSMRKYWDGFEPNSTKKKPKEDTVPGHIPSANNEEPSAITTSYYSGSALWRLKDWPPGQDFNEILPDHYNDFMNNLPLKPYTTRTGKLNLACRLPKEMLKPDLGPKMYSAYGTTKFPERGTTNLHLDISDAVNVMVYVGGAMPYEQGSSEYSEIYENTINDCYVDQAMKDQIRKKKLVPGALWHIFKPSDVVRIREFLNRVSDECNISVEKRIDPIHDQTWYLDQKLLDRLYNEYGVKSYSILQCMGDAILIPAGAPHQVKNLQNCIKVANDFVSPENIRYCLQLTNEFRNLPETHINQEDKLQIKNIMYHSVKDSIQYIKMFESGKVQSEDESTSEEHEPSPGGDDINPDDSMEV